ncbi:MULTISPECIES: hypothetical protein [unclassified Nitratiruptor]|uniref:hypothetical protein n=1 Tax=unclassified Nitratiruptor TaxID=2624044 RepID=UPI0019169524|nr:MULTISPECIES: hypothetical protein [unclassified Nitratiruptor]BCD59435.1 hypothetical protein NitYY0810_C0171 [Nitratiruptor sp. YY08-10]BCD63359.1 hypothetical protein NitYY0814_C0171 [Nitratiruptor sp. YY08-14]
MINDVVKLLKKENEAVADMQNNRPLIVMGNSPFKIYIKGKYKSQVLTNIVFYDEKYDTKRYARNIQLETLNIFQPNSVLYKGNLTYYGEMKNFAIDLEMANKEAYRFDSLDKDLQMKILKTLAASKWDYFRIIESENIKIIIPAYSIGNFFYYPNSYIKRAFFAQSMAETLVNEGLSECEEGAICFAYGVKFTKINVILSYFYHCDPRASAYFYNAFSYFMKEPVKKYYENGLRSTESDYILQNPKFAFPLVSRKENVTDVLFRGAYLDEKTFLVYEIVDVDFKSLLGKEKLIGFYEGKKKAKTVTTSGFSHGKADTKSISNTAPYNFKFERGDKAFAERGKESIDELIVEKGKAVCRGEALYRIPVKQSFEVSEGISLGEVRDPNSRYAKGRIYKLSFDFKEAMRLLERRLGISGKLIDEREFYGFLFWWNRRNYFVLELKNFNAQTYLFSSNRGIEFKKVANEILSIRKMETGKNLKEYRKELQGLGIHFHTPQKHTGESLEKWVERLIGKI